MILLIDSGNTSIKWALATTPNTPWIAQGNASHTQLADVATTWHALSFTRVLISHVATDAIREHIQQILLAHPKASQMNVQWFSAQAQLGNLHNHYQIPHQLGADRFANLFATSILFNKQACLVVSSGTACTIDTLDHNAHFYGGRILPGLQTMVKALTEHTAHLPTITPDKVTPPDLNYPFADNTIDAIISGCVSAHIGAITQAFTTYQQKYNDAVCILTGGAAQFISPNLTIPHRVIDHLVLIGLAHAAQIL